MMIYTSQVQPRADAGDLPTAGHAALLSTLVGEVMAEAPVNFIATNDETTLVVIAGGPAATVRIGLARRA